MAEYHVGCGIAGIYAGITNKDGTAWKNKSEVTIEALQAVALYIHDENKDHGFDEKEFHGYNFPLSGGRVLRLCTRIDEVTGNG